MIIEEYTRQDIKRNLIKLILLGDKADNIPNVYYGTQYTKEFEEFLVENNILIDPNPDEIEILSITEILKKEFKEKYPDKEIYKKVRFGEKTAEKVLRNFQNFKKELENSIQLKKRFNLNNTLINLKNIPEDIEEEIVQELDKIDNKDYIQNKFTIDSIDILEDFINKYDITEAYNFINILK